MASKIGSAFTTVGGTMASIGKTIAPVSAAFAAAMTGSVVGASNFTDGMAKMSTLFDTSENSVSDLADQFLQLSNKTGLSATELAEAGYQALSAGQSVENVAGFVENAGNLAKAGFTSTSTAVDVLTTIMNAYGESAGSAEQIANKLVKTQNQGKTTVDELASSMGKIIPTAASMNVDINNLAAGYVFLTKQGIATSEATTYMNSMLNELGKGGTEVAKIIKQQTGQSFQDLMASGNSVGDALQVLQNYCNKSGKSLIDLFGSAEAAKAALTILNGGVDEFNLTAETMTQETNDVNEALQKLYTPSEQMKQALNMLKNAGIELGTALLEALSPAITFVSGLISDLTNWFSSLDSNTQTVIATIGLFIAALAPVLIIGGNLVSGIGTAITTIGNAVTAIGGLNGAIGALTSPIAIAIAAIVGLIAIIVYLYNTNESFRALCQTVWANVQNLISVAIAAIQGIITRFVAVVQAFWTQWGSTITSVATTAWSLVVGFVTTALSVLNGIITAITAAIQGNWSAAWAAVQSVVVIVWNAIAGTVSTVLTTVYSVISAIITAIQISIITKFTTVSTFISNIFNSISSTVSTIWTNIQTTISDKIEAAKTTVSDTIEAIKGFFSFSWSWPSLPLPHIVYDLITLPLIGTIPNPATLGVSWYAKGGVMTDPTAFGINGNNLMVGGEAGPEAIAPIDVLQKYVADAVASQNTGVVTALDKILNAINKMNADMGANMADALEGTQLSINHREFGRLVRGAI